MLTNAKLKTFVDMGQFALTPMVGSSVHAKPDLKRSTTSHKANV